MTQGFEPHGTETPPVEFEKRDVAWRPVLTMLGAVTVVIIAFYVIVTVMFGAMVGRTKYTTEPFGEQAEAMVQQLQKLREREEQLLTNYQWVSHEHRVVRIPIDRAIDMVVAEYGDKQP